MKSLSKIWNNNLTLSKIKNNRDFNNYDFSDSVRNDDLIKKVITVFKTDKDISTIVDILSKMTSLNKTNDTYIKSIMSAITEKTVNWRSGISSGIDWYIKLFNENYDTFMNVDSKWTLWKLSLFLSASSNEKIINLQNDHSVFFYEMLSNNLKTKLKTNYFDKYSPIYPQIAKQGVDLRVYSNDNIDTDFIETSKFNCNTNLLVHLNNKAITEWKEFKWLSKETVKKLPQAYLLKYADELLTYGDKSDETCQYMIDNWVALNTIIKYNNTLSEKFQINDFDNEVQSLYRRISNLNPKKYRQAKVLEKLKYKDAERRLLKEHKLYWDIFDTDTSISYDNPKTIEEKIFAAHKKFYEGGWIQYLLYMEYHISEIDSPLEKSPFTPQQIADLTELKIFSSEFFEKISNTLTIKDSIINADIDVWDKKENYDKIWQSIENDPDTITIAIKKIINKKGEHKLLSIFLAEKLIEQDTETSIVKSLLLMSKLKWLNSRWWYFSLKRAEIRRDSSNDSYKFNEQLLEKAAKAAEKKWLFKEIDKYCWGWTANIHWSWEYINRLMDKNKISIVSSREESKLWALNSLPLDLYIDHIKKVIEKNHFNNENAFKNIRYSILEYYYSRFEIARWTHSSLFQRETSLYDWTIVPKLMDELLPVILDKVSNSLLLDWSYLSDNENEFFNSINWDVPSIWIAQDEAINNINIKRGFNYLKSSFTRKWWDNEYPLDFVTYWIFNTTNFDWLFSNEKNKTARKKSASLAKSRIKNMLKKVKANEFNEAQDKFSLKIVNSYSKYLKNTDDFKDFINKIVSDKFFSNDSSLQKMSVLKKIGIL